MAGCTREVSCKGCLIMLDEGWEREVRAKDGAGSVLELSACKSEVVESFGWERGPTRGILRMSGKQRTHFCKGGKK